ncbi:MAG TPA: beta-ketoacyl-[acyl-carrier-protein] synthase family protein [Thermoleophilaceae bacterium]|jgi:3-oxoacyl-[acyl-carrier-protein] synthase II
MEAGGDAIAITGVGAVTPFGVGAELLFERWVAGESAIHNGIAAASDFDPADHLSRKEIRAADRFTQMTLVAAEEAIRAAGWRDAPPCPPERIGSVIATGVGGLETIEEQFDVFRENGPRRLSPLGVVRLMPNAATASAAIRYGWRGETCTVSAACAAGLQALGAGVRMIQTGSIDAVAVGASDATLTEFTVAAFDVMGAVSESGNCRPYDRRRDGFIPGEGAGVLLLERASGAAARGAEPLATLNGYGATTDAHDLAAPPPGGDGITRAIRLALESARLEPGDIDYVNSHGASSLVGDQVETSAIKDSLGQRARTVPVSSTKSVIGHLQTAAGAVEAIATVLAVRHGVAPPTVGLEQQDPELDLFYVPGEPVPITDGSGKHARAGLSFCFGLGGHNAAVIVSVADGNGAVA